MLPLSGQAQNFLSDTPELSVSFLCPPGSVDACPSKQDNGSTEGLAVYTAPNGLSSLAPVSRGY